MKRFGIRGNKSYLVKFFIYFLSVLFVPVATIVILNIKSQAIVKKQILLSNQNTLTQVFQLIDTVLVEMRETCVTIANLEIIEDYAKVSDDYEQVFPYKIYEIKQTLNTYSKQKFTDIFVYFPQNQYVISNVHGALISDYYYKTYYGKDGDFREDFYNNLNCDSGYPVLRVMNSWGEKTYLCVTMKHTIGRNQESYIVSVVLDDDYLNQLICNNNAGRGGCILLFDQNKELLLAGNKEKIPYDMRGYSDEDSHYKARFGKEDYVMQIHESSALKGYYAFAIPYDFFWEQISGIRFFSIIGILVCTSIGVILSFYASKRAYAPIGQIVDKMQKKVITNYDAMRLTEFEFLEEMFQNENEEKLRLYKEINKRTKVESRERVLIKLLEGDTSEVSSDDIKKNGIILCSDCFLAGLLQVDDGEKNQDFNHFIISNVFEEICNRLGKGYVISLMEYRYILLINLSEDEKEERIMEKLEEGMKFLKRHYMITMTIGCSRIHEGVQEIHEAYLEAQKAVRYRYLLGKGQIITYHSIEDREFSYPTFDKAKLSIMIDDYLEKTLCDDVPKFVSEIFDAYGIDGTISLETMECFKFDVINALNKVILQCGCAANERRDVFIGLLEKETLPEFGEHLSYVLILLHQKRKDQMNHSDICQQTREYIEENYANMQLSVSLLGEVMEVSASYLSKLYKKKYGISILDDISRTRIKKSKSLLQNTSMNVNEVAEQTGFMSSNVFIKAFKKWEGITPGRYRELI